MRKRKEIVDFTKQTPVRSASLSQVKSYLKKNDEFFEALKKRIPIQSMERTTINYGGGGLIDRYTFSNGMVFDLMNNGFEVMYTRRR